MDPQHLETLAKQADKLARTLRGNPNQLAERVNTFAATGWPTQSSTTPDAPTEQAAIQQDRTAIRARTLQWRLTTLTSELESITNDLIATLNSDPTIIACPYCTDGRIPVGDRICGNPRCVTSKHKPCAKPDCGRKGTKTGLCPAHYQQTRRQRNTPK